MLVLIHFFYVAKRFKYLDIRSFGALKKRIITNPNL